MIGRLRGHLLQIGADRILIETSAGVGYEVRVAPRTLMELPPINKEITVFIHTQVREDAITLYGFLDDGDKRVFQEVQAVKGIGPKLSLAIVGTVDPTTLASALLREDIPGLCKIPGLGKKTAARLCLELKDKLPAVVAGLGMQAPSEAPALVPTGRSDAEEDAVQALAALGYSGKEIARAMKVVDPQTEDTVQSLLRRALQSLSPN